MRRKLQRGTVVLTLLLCLSGLFGAFPVRSSADDVSGVVTGYAYDQNHQPIRGARVILASAESPVLTRTTNPNGRFLFLAVLPGYYTAWASADGYDSPCRWFLYIFPGQTKLVRFPMSPRAMMEFCSFSDVNPIQF